MTDFLNFLDAVRFHLELRNAGEAYGLLALGVVLIFTGVMLATDRRLP